MESILFWAKKKVLPSKVKSISPTTTPRTCPLQAPRSLPHLSVPDVLLSPPDPSTRRYIRRSTSHRDSPLAFLESNWRSYYTALAERKVKVSTEEPWASLRALNRLMMCFQTILDKRVTNTSIRRSIEISKLTTLWLVPQPITNTMPLRRMETVSM